MPDRRPRCTRPCRAESRTSSRRRILTARVNRPIIDVAGRPSTGGRKAGVPAVAHVSREPASVEPTPALQEAT